MSAEPEDIPLLLPGNPSPHSGPSYPLRQPDLFYFGFSLRGKGRIRFDPTPLCRRPPPRSKKNWSIYDYFPSAPRPNCFQRLSLELYYEIFLYLPWVTVRTRLHADPLKLYDYENYSKHTAICRDEAKDVVGGRCVLDQLYEDGCGQYCKCSRAWKWTTILHVCKKWSQVAEACPQLWTRIPLYDKKAFQRALVLSKNAALDVSDYSVNAGPTEALLRAVIPHFHRVQKLSLPAYLFPDMGNQLQCIINALFSYAAPNLVSLSLSTPFGWEKIPKDEFQAMVPPRLRELRLDGVSAVPDSLLFAPTITFLELSSFISWVTAKDMINTLSRMPMLEEIRIQNLGVMPTDMTMGSEPDERLSVGTLYLQHLRVVHLTLDIWALIHFLEIVQFPALTVLKLSFEHGIELSAEMKTRCLEYLSYYLMASSEKTKPFVNAEFMVQLCQKSNLCNAELIFTSGPRLASCYSAVDKLARRLLSVGHTWNTSSTTDLPTAFHGYFSALVHHVQIKDVRHQVARRSPKSISSELEKRITGQLFAGVEI